MASWQSGGASRRITLAEARAVYPAAVCSKIAHNTFRYVETCGAYRVRHMDTDLVTVDPRGRVTLDSGGWRTVTTADRLSSALRPLGWSLGSTAGNWTLQTPAGSYAWVDGAKIRPDGSACNPARHAAEARRGAIVKARIKSLLAKYAAGKFDLSGARDPWVFGTAPNFGVSRHAMGDWLRSQYATVRLLDIAYQHAGRSQIHPQMVLSDVARGRRLSTYDVRPIRTFAKFIMGV